MNKNKARDYGRGRSYRGRSDEDTMNKAHDCGRGRSYERGRGLGDEDIMTGEKIIIVVFLIFNQTLNLIKH